MEIWVVCTSNQLFIAGSLMVKLSFQENKVVGVKAPFFVIVAFSIIVHSVCLNIGF